MMPLPISNAEKAAVWQAYHDRKPLRVPLRWNVNSRVLLLNPALNPEGIGYRDYFNDATTMLQVQAHFAEYSASELSQSCDMTSELPEQWFFFLESQNIYDSAYFGGEVRFEAGQVPCVHHFLTLDDVDDFLTRDFSQPLENPWIKERLRFHAELTAAAKDFTYLGRRGTVAPFGLGFDGPLTVAANLFGSDFFSLLGEEPEKAVEVMLHITRAAITRNQALSALNGQPLQGDWGSMADDSIQLISTGMYVNYIMPIHELIYASLSTTRPQDMRRSIHLCGDATRHFKTIHEQLGVISFDTGFPVDHGWLRAELGDDVEISGGPRVDLLKSGTTDECFAAARDILQSGIMRGGRFILQEANNLPPSVPMANLQAVYAACQEFGRYD